MKNNVASDILIWNKEIGFIKICEGTGDNLLREDIAEGYVDYMMIDGYSYNGSDLVEDYDIVEGGQAMLTEYYQDMFETPIEVINYLIEGDWIPNVDYTILYAE